LSRILVGLFLVLVALLPEKALAQERITVFAAASLKEVMDRASAAFKEESGTEVVVSLASSSVLARQIEAGAPADIFISADQQWMDWAAQRNLIRDESRRVVAGNELVIVGAEPAPAGTGPDIILSTARFAMGDPTHVPAGIYAKAALTSLGLWNKVRERAVFGENVRVALELAERGEVSAAIVYASDQLAAKELARIYTFPAESHPPIIYPAAATAKAKPEADAFLDFLAGENGRKIFRDLGFAPPAS